MLVPGTVFLLFPRKLVVTDPKRSAVVSRLVIWSHPPETPVPVRCRVRNVGPSTVTTLSRQLTQPLSPILHCSSPPPWVDPLHFTGPLPLRPWSRREVHVEGELYPYSGSEDALEVSRSSGDESRL